MTAALTNGPGNFTPNGTGSLPSFHFSTKMLPPKDQFDAWRTFAAPVIDISLSSGQKNFAAEQTIWSFGNFVLSMATMPTNHTRIWKHMNKDPLDHWCLVIPEPLTSSPSALSHRPRQLHFRSLGRPLEGSAADSSVLLLFIPRDAFKGMAATIDNVPTTIADIGLGSILIDYLLSTHRRLPDMSAQELPHLATATQSMLAACLTQAADHTAQAREQLESTLQARAREIVAANLHSPDFNNRELCRLLGISRSSLYRLFERLGGVTHYIQRQRLLHARSLLADPSNTMPIFRIAENACFYDASSFSRAFKQEFGVNPRDIRADTHFARPESQPIHRSPACQPQDLGDVLCRLQG
ncbi:MAG: helix-turn-helix domain-containing protein [Phyllobacterium sp.]